VSIAAALIRVDGKGSATVAMLTGGFALSEIHLRAEWRSPRREKSGNTAADERRLTRIGNDWLKTTDLRQRRLSAADDRGAGFFSDAASDTMGPLWSAIVTP
jgi:hypothetical protein